jgi:hypothetical protein
LQHKGVDPTFHLLPTEEGSTAGAITKASDIPNNEVNIKKYVKNVHDVDNPNNSKTYTVVFYVKIASATTLGTMKNDNGLFYVAKVEQHMDSCIPLQSYNRTNSKNK